MRITFAPLSHHIIICLGEGNPDGLMERDEARHNGYY